MLKEILLDILLPKKCVGCKKEGQYICKDCELFFSEIPQMSKVEPYSVWEYEGIIEKAILKIKYDGYYDIINELVEKAFEKIDLNLPEDTYITYVPMYKKREKERGFNQAELIAKKVGLLLLREKQRPIKVLSLLTKIKDNRSQVGLGPQERLENVRGVFELKPSEVESRPPKAVLLIDDVYTTGATMNECTKVLRKARIRDIYGFTLARKLRI